VKACVLLLPILAGCAAVQGAPTTEAAPLEVQVVRSGDAWTADFHLDRDAPVWVFSRSPLAVSNQQSWRAASWTVLTPGVRLERLGRYDVLRATGDRPVPAHVRIRFSPFPGDVDASYNPALVFTDGSVALYSEQFAAFPLSSAEEAARLPVDLQEAHLPESRTQTTYRDTGGPLLHTGQRLPSLTLQSADTGTYVFFGRTEPVVDSSLTAIYDPQLPGWLRTALARWTPAILARYAGLLGPFPEGRPTLLVNWRGASPNEVTMSGSSLSGLIVMSFEGERLLKEDRRAAAQNLWFIAHEAAHFWLGQTVRYSTPFESWITEGGADLLAIRAVAAIDPSFDSRAELQREVDDCIALSAGRGVARAIERNEFRAYYACGATFGLVAEASSGRPFTDFVRSLIDANRSDGIVTRNEWLALLDEVSNDPVLSRDIGRLLDVGASDPKAAIRSLFRRAGVRHTVAPDGTPKLS
jgi:hypothetical protein